ncbi:hypothetical protein [Aequorivita aquimaris]|uniref:hypothetical protein n=1 Tax=Aequorivita aquimaris TaxID=1548749 RepID=UPI000789576A|nr:hypothetical protein [Aequorivita aquimaris]
MKITKSEIKILLGIGILILLIDILLMKYWISTIKPDPFMSIGVESYRPHIFGVNILIGIIVFFFKKRLSILFFVNSIVCYLIFSFLWNSWIENHPYSSTEYSFQIEDRKFILGIDKNPDHFGIDEIVSESKDSLITIGMHEKVGDSLKLTSMQEKMYFYNNKLIGFSINPTQIELNKIE